MTSVGDSSEMLSRLMSASTLRAKVLSENIANQNVPGYKRKIVRFEELLTEHFKAGARSLDAVTPRIETDLATPSSGDGNNVNLEIEANAMRENALLYQLYATILQTKFDMVQDSIREGR
jgi:flagellar basal-body rod protein FlgB